MWRHAPSTARCMAGRRGWRACEGRASGEGQVDAVAARASVSFGANSTARHQPERPASQGWHATQAVHERCRPPTGKTEPLRGACRPNQQNRLLYCSQSGASSRSCRRGAVVGTFSQGRLLLTDPYRGTRTGRNSPRKAEPTQPRARRDAR